MAKQAESTEVLFTDPLDPREAEWKPLPISRDNQGPILTGGLTIHLLDAAFRVKNSVRIQK